MNILPSHTLTVVVTFQLYFECLFNFAICWPEGTYGVPMAESGCPHSTNFDWLTGSRTQATEKGSHGTENSHLAGIDSTKNKADDKIVQNFCIKTSYPRDGNYTWQPGKYCIYKKNTCPKNFKEGHIYWDDSGPIFFGESKIQSYSGVLPDGTYDKNTHINFCCRTDGSASEEIILPTSSDFYLLQYGRQCQKVKNMIAVEEWVYWAGENTFNFDTEGGAYPRLTRAKFPTKFTRLYYCFYSPKEAGSNFQTALTVAYVFAGVVAFVIVSFIFLCIVQRCHSTKYHETPHNAENHGPMIQYTAGSNNKTTHCLMYRTSRDSTTPASRKDSHVVDHTGDHCLNAADDDYTMIKSNSGSAFGYCTSDKDRAVPSAPPEPALPSPPSYNEVIYKVDGDPV